MAKESWGIPSSSSTSVTHALVLEARASEARLLLGLKNHKIPKKDVFHKIINAL